MDVNKIIMTIMAIGFVIGGIDKIAGNKLGLGSRFEEGIRFLAVYTFSMAGILCLVPVLSEGFRKLFAITGTGIVDPGFVGGIVGIGVGGFGLSMELAKTSLLGKFSGIIVGSMLGATLTFTIPVGYTLIKKEDRDYFSRGLMLGLIPIPVGCFTAGCMMKVPMGELLANELPVILLAVVLIIGLYFVPDKMSALFAKIGTVIQILALIGLILGGFTYISGIEVVPNMDALMKSMATISGMCIVLAGSFTVLELVMRWGRTGLTRIGEKIGLDAEAVSGMLFSCLSTVPAMSMLKDMNPTGKVACTAFLVSSTCVFGGQLSYAAAEAPDCLVPMIVGKLISAFLGMGLAIIFANKLDKNVKCPLT